MRILCLLLAANLLTATAPAQGAVETMAASQQLRISDPELFEKSLDAARRALEVYGEAPDVEANERVARIGYELAQFAGFTDFPLTFFVADISVPNAFALPGGHIFVTRGMLDQGIDDAQLAGLLGHEIAHVTKRHGVRLQKRANLLNVLSQAVVLGAILTSDGGRQPNDVPPDRWGRTSTNSGNRIYGAAATGLVLSELLLRSYSREFEDEADEEGQRLAAAAGYPPNGTVELMDTLGTRMPQNREYGYWQTHPFFQERVRAAQARAELIRADASPRPPELYRVATQNLLLETLEAPPEVALEKQRDADRNRRDELRPPSEPERDPVTRRLFLEKAALVAWPTGPAAERLRLSALERLRTRELERPEIARDYGALLTAWTEQRKVVERLSPDSPFVATLSKGIEELEGAADAAYPRAAAVFEQGVWETAFLESYLSNWPESPEAARVALSLGDARARLRLEGEAAESYLTAWRLDPEGEVGARALSGLRRMAPRLDDLGALERLATDGSDDAVRSAAAARLEKLATSYDDLGMGAEYLRDFPAGSRVKEIEARLDTVADRLYGEIVLYQAVGDGVKAATRVAEILTHAPFSPAADRLRERTLTSDG